MNFLRPCCIGLHVWKEESESQRGKAQVVQHILLFPGQGGTSQESGWSEGRWTVSRDSLGYTWAGFPQGSLFPSLTPWRWQPLATHSSRRQETLEQSPLRFTFCEAKEVGFQRVTTWRSPAQILPLVGEHHAPAEWHIKVFLEYPQLGRGHG